MRIVAIADDDSLVGHLEEDTVDAVLGVRANHDTDTQFASFVRPMHFTIESFGGLTFGGFDGSWRYKPKGHHMYEQGEVSRMLRAFPKVDVFIAHNSPWGIHERDNDVHQGFKGFLEYIERAKPAYFIHGHQHMNITSRHGETEVIGVFGEKAFTLNQ